MKTKSLTFLTPHTSHLTFAFACFLLGGAGWAAKMGVDRIGSVHDEISAGVNHPSSAFLRNEWHRTNSLAVQQSPTSSVLLFPTNHATPVFQ